MNFRFIQLIALSGAITLSAAFGLSRGRWASLAALAQFQWHEESQVGGVAIAGKFSHLNLARLVPSGRRIIGGVRYTQREQKNSSVFYSLDGKKVERLFFSVRL